MQFESQNFSEKIDAYSCKYNAYLLPSIMIRFQTTFENRQRIAKWLLDRPVLIYLTGFVMATGSFGLSVLLIILCK